MAVVFLCGVANAKAMEEQSELQESFRRRMTSMVEAATRAAAAERALERSSTSTGSNEGLSAPSRALKAPDVFSGEDAMLFQQWKYKFTSWLCFGDCRCSEALDNLEKKSEAPPLSSGNADEKQMSQKLFAVLTSYLRGKCAHMVRAKAKNKDGLRFCHSLNHEYMPSRRQRSLASAQALGAYPCFNKDKSALEPILNFEQLVMQYEEASGSVYPKELMAATLIRCCQPNLREQLQLSITDETSYGDIRDKITAYERVVKTWTSD